MSNAWVRASVPGQQVGAAYLEISSLRAAALVDANCSVAAAAELHAMSHEDGVMKMRSLERIDLPAGRTVKLAPGGNHIMLLGLKRQLKAGETVGLTLVLQHPDKTRTRVQISAPVRSGTASH